MKLRLLALSAALALSASTVLAEDFSKASWMKADDHPLSFNAKRLDHKVAEAEVFMKKKHGWRADESDRANFAVAAAPRGAAPALLPAVGEAWAKESPTDLVPAAPVPEPETYALMLAGLGAVAFIARRRQKR